VSPAAAGSRPLAPALGLLLALAGGCGADGSAELLTARRGDLEVQLGLRGTLQAVRDVSIKSPRWGEIKRMAVNGSLVKAGDTVLELVADDAENSARELRSDVEVRAAELRQAEQEVSSADRAAGKRLAVAKLDRELQDAYLKELAARPTERELAEAGSRLDLAKALLAAAEEAVGLVRELVKSGYAPQEDLRQAEREVLAVRAELAAAESRLQAVKAGPTAFERQQAAVRLEAAQLAEESAAKSIQVTKELGESKLARCTRRLEREKEKLTEAERKLDESSVKCPVDGLVLYAQRRWGGTWQVGYQVWQGATVMTVPELSRMKVTVQVPAERVRELEGRSDLAARIRVVALADKLFSGKVAKVSAIGRDEFEGLDPATSEKLGRAERQVFEAEVVLDEEDRRLRPGLSAEAKIVLKRVPDAVIVPITALAMVPRPAAPAGAAPLEKPGPAGRRAPGAGGEGAGRDGRRPPATAILWVKTAGGFQERTVRVLARNEFEAAVEGPVEAGDRLYPGRAPGAKKPGAAEPKPAAPAPAGGRP